MGLITGLFTLPWAPVRGVIWVAEQLQEQARRQLEDPQVLHRQLMEVEAAKEAGTITEEEAKEREAELVRRVWEARRAGRGRRA